MAHRLHQTNRLRPLCLKCSAFKASYFFFFKGKTHLSREVSKNLVYFLQQQVSFKLHIKYLQKLVFPLSTALSRILLLNWIQLLTSCAVGHQPSRKTMFYDLTCTSDNGNGANILHFSWTSQHLILQHWCSSKRCSRPKRIWQRQLSLFLNSPLMFYRGLFVWIFHSPSYLLKNRLPSHLIKKLFFHTRE